MKKTIAILLVLAVVMTGVFAATGDTAKVKLNANVAEESVIRVYAADVTVPSTYKALKEDTTQTEVTKTVTSAIDAVVAKVAIGYTGTGAIQAQIKSATTFTADGVEAIPYTINGVAQASLANTQLAAISAGTAARVASGEMRLVITAEDWGKAAASAAYAADITIEIASV